MKNIYIITALLVSSWATIAQNKQTKEADKLFDRLEYVDAAKAYLKLTDKGQNDPYLYKQLADSYYEIFNTKEAVKWYAKTVQTPQKSETYYRYAQMLKAEGDYNLADAMMEKFASMTSDDSRATAFKSSSDYMQQLLGQAKLYEVKKVSVSTDKSEFGPFLSNQGELFFASAGNKARKAHGMNEEPYLDLYKAILNTDGTLSNAALVEGVNTKWHDGPACVTSDGNTMYFASESFNDNQFQKNKEKKLKYGQIYLYKATRSGDGWSNIKALPFNNKDYSVRNPSVSKDGKTLYFSSNMPGGKGGEDIYKVSIDGDNFGTPENLGDNVNTEANESFPFITNENHLFFSSNGKTGLGGYDIFDYEIAKNQKAINVGAPVNTQKDDFSFSFNAEKNIGYFASNREGNDDIFSADPICNVEAIVMVKDKETNMPLANAIVNAMDSKNNKIGSSTTDENGVAKFTTACDEEHGFQVNREGYLSNSGSMSKARGGSTNTTIDLEPIKVIITEKEVILQPIFFEYNKSNITAQGAEELNKLVAVMNEYPNMVIFAKSHTDNRGNDSFNLKLSERRAKATVQYIISKGIDTTRISGQGFGETEPKDNCQECSDEQHATNRRSEFLIIKK